MNHHMESALENIILNAKGMLCFKNVEPMANPRGERRGQWGVTLALRKWGNTLTYF